MQWWIMAIISFTCFSSSCGHTLPSTNLRHQSHNRSEQRVRILIEPSHVLARQGPSDLLQHRGHNRASLPHLVRSQSTW